MEVRGKRELEVTATPSGAVGLPPDWMNIKFWSPANNHQPTTCLLLPLRRLKYVSGVKSNTSAKCMARATWHEFTDTQFLVKKKKKGKEEKRVWRAINPGHQFADGRGVENERERSVYLWNRGSGSMRPPLASILTNKFREQKTALGHAAVAESSFGPSAFEPRRRCQGFGPASNHFYRFLLSSSRKKKRGGARAGHDTEQRLPKAHVTSVFGTRPSR